MSSLKTIDISKPIDEIAKPLLEAATQQGFLFVEGHQFYRDEIDSLFSISENFFTRTPIDIKRKYTTDNKSFGYATVGEENLDPDRHKDHKESFNIQLKCIEDISKEDAVLPDIFAANLQLFVEVVDKLHETANKILDAIAVGLELDDINFFRDRHKKDQPNETVFRMLRYPTVDSDSVSSVRAGAHTDYGSITLLFQREGQQGLEVAGPNAGLTQWSRVPYIKATKPNMAPPLVVNFGDLLSYWTNGFIKSTRHRVCLTKEDQVQDRYSIVYFVHPGNNVTLNPLKSKFVKYTSEERITITAQEYLEQRLDATY